MAEVRLEGVSKSFGDLKVLDDISLDIKDGEFFTLLGPSGCGKTTALRLIAGLETPDAGAVRIGDRDVTRVPPARRRVAMVFQNYALYPHMSISENICYPLRIRKAPGEKIKSKVKEVAEKLYLDGLLDRMPSQVSGGQQQRVAVARAMVQDPLVYLFDEPLSNLDARLRLEARRFLKRIQKETAVTAIYVTHDQTEAMAMSDRVAVLKGGRLLQVASPEDIYAAPADVFVAGFVGSPPMNLIDGKITGDSEGVRFSAEGFSVELDRSLNMESGTGITLGIRPEHVYFEPGKGRRRLDCTIEDIERLGSETIVSAAAGDTIILSRLQGTEAPARGKKISLFLSSRDFHVFDERGNRIAENR